MGSKSEEQHPPEPARQVAARWHERHALRSFEGDIREQEDLLFGVALFFDVTQFLHAGQETMLETYRKELRNILQLGRQSVEHARHLLDAARQDPSKGREIQEFRFQPCQGAAHPEELKRSAQAFLQTYQELFPRRPRTEPLAEEEIVRLINRAADRV